MLETVIFDLDGLLVDSEPLQFRAYQEVFSKHGVEFEFSDWPEWHRLEASASRWIATHNLPLDPELVRSDKKLIYEALIDTELTLKPGARRLIESLSGRYRLCVASGSRPESIEACLSRFSLSRHFENQFSATLLRRKKPYPDVYIEALTKMQVKSQHAIAIEDSVTGLKSAKAAGLECIVCPDTFVSAPISNYDGAALIVDSLEKLLQMDLEQFVNTNDRT